MGLAQSMKKDIQERFKQYQTERKADKLTQKIASKKVKAEYRKTYVDESIKKAKVEAKKDAKYGGRFKRTLSEGLSKLKQKDTKGKSSQSDMAREKLSIGNKGKNPFEL
jgi:hypothetical protein